MVLARAKNALTSYSASSRALRFNALGSWPGLCPPGSHTVSARSRHAVKTRSDLTKLVVAVHVHPAEKSPDSSALSRGATAPGVDNVQIARIKHHNRTSDGQRHHHQTETGSVWRSGSKAAFHIASTRPSMACTNRWLRPPTRRAKWGQTTVHAGFATAIGHWQTAQRRLHPRAQTAVGWARHCAAVAALVKLEPTHRSALAPTQLYSAGQAPFAYAYAQLR